MYEALSTQTQQSYQNVSRETFWYDWQSRKQRKLGEEFSADSSHRDAPAYDAAREGDGGGRRGCGEEALQQKRIKGERADRDAPWHRPLLETPHPQSPQRLFSGPVQQKDIGRSESPTN